MKLFIWNDFSPDYNSGLAFAIAKDEADARKQVLNYLGYDPVFWGELKVMRLDRRACRAITGGG